MKQLRQCRYGQRAALQDLPAHQGRTDVCRVCQLGDRESSGQASLLGITLEKSRESHLAGCPSSPTEAVCLAPGPMVGTNVTDLVESSTASYTTTAPSAHPTKQCNKLGKQGCLWTSLSADPRGGELLCSQTCSFPALARKQLLAVTNSGTAHQPL